MLAIAGRCDARQRLRAWIPLRIGPASAMHQPQQVDGSLESNVTQGLGQFAEPCAP